jgi:peptide-methionine (S)-S-oxide reductase
MHQKHPPAKTAVSYFVSNISARLVQVTYDPTKLGYKTLLDTFWINIDPLDGQGQFCDKGEQYRSAVFYQNNEQKILAEKSLENIASKLDKNIETTLIKATTFYPAEEYHQIRKTQFFHKYIILILL